MLDIQFNPCEGDVLRLWTATASLRRQHSQPKRTKASPPPPENITDSLHFSPGKDTKSISVVFACNCISAALLVSFFVR